MNTKQQRQLAWGGLPGGCARRGGGPWVDVGRRRLRRVVGRSCHSAPRPGRGGRNSRDLPGVFSATMPDQTRMSPTLYDVRRGDDGLLRTEEQGVLPAGPWHAEPDRADLEHAGLPCLLLRHDHGHWCGYVGLPDDHPWSGIDFSDLDAIHESRESWVGLPEVHGGVTWNRGCDDLRSRRVSRHWVGFDCGHMASGDLVLSPRSFLEISARGEYRTLAYARVEVEKLAAQAARVGGLTCARGEV